MTTLVIVESPGKVKTISSILGDGYRVMASVGHVRDLPPKELGVEPPLFQPHYEPTERGRDVLAKLKQAVAAADRVLLATDPDREGEAIAWHLADALKLKNPERIAFTAITNERVKAAVQVPRAIDMHRVKAQEARRALDRIVGYRVSPALSDRAGQPLSAGRVQSPAVRLVVDREREIANFNAVQHYGAELIFSHDAGEWRAQWDTKPHLREGEHYMLDSDLAQRAAAVRNLTVSTFEDTEIGRAPAAPFTTSTLQQAAGQRLKMKPKRAMELAQKLYEAGHITYMRTDNPNLDPAGIEDITAYARTAGLPLTDKSRRWKAKEGAQEGHEAIRPTHADVIEAGDDADQMALYRLIWQRAIASQLADANYAVRTVTLAGNADDTPATFIARGRTLIDPGWMAVYADDADDIAQEEGEEAGNSVPKLVEGASITASDGRLLTKTTKPPARFKQPTLIAELERRGIGRPSTYAAILDNITTRGYVAEDAKGFLTPSPIGMTIRDALVGRFTFVDLDYTKKLEEQLDLIAEAQADYTAVVAGAWHSLDRELGALDSAKIEAAYPCPECGKPMHRRNGSNGYFWGCSGFRDNGCKVTLPDERGKPGQRKAPPAPTGFHCTRPDCGKPLARRQGVSKPKKKGEKGRPYDFYSCTGYPKCDATYQTGEDGKPVFVASESVQSPA